jgi:hypothetical protein
MPSQTDKSKALFTELAADYQKARREIADTVACPLCLAEWRITDIEELSCEHVVPKSLGGRTETLTCRRRCNNTHGPRLDSHLIKAMRAMDAIDGLEPIDTRLGSDKGKIVAELLLGDGTLDQPNQIRIVGEASNLKAADDLRNSLRDGYTLNLQMRFQYKPDRFFRGAFRAAFLAVFKSEGYTYALSQGAAQVRAMLECDGPVLEKVVMEAFPEREPDADVLVMPATFNDVGEHYLVLLRLRTKRTRYIVVFLPGKSGGDWSAFEALYQHAPLLRVETTPFGWDSKLYIHLGFDPIFRVRTGLRDHFLPAQKH